VIEAQRSRAIVEADARRSYAADGFLATSSWLAHRLGVSASTAAQHVRLARALALMDRSRIALANGEISTSAAAVLATAHEADRERFGEAEPVLLEAARALSVRDLFRAIEHWKMLVNAESGEAAAARRFERRRFSPRPRSTGWSGSTAIWTRSFGRRRDRFRRLGVVSPSAVTNRRASPPPASRGT
jgi:hypothetical protein